MSNANTKSDTSVKVISDAREEEILSIFRTLHSKVLTACTEVGVKPTFNDKFEACGAADYKELHQMSRTLINAKRTAKWEARIAGIRVSVQGVVNAYMVKARAAKSALDALPAEVKQFMPSFSTTVKIPLSDIRACFPQGTTDSQLFSDLEKLGYKVTDLTTKGQVIVPFTTGEEKVAEKAPESQKQTKAA